MATQTHSKTTPAVRSSSGEQRRSVVGAHQTDTSLPSSASLSNEAYTRLVVLVSDGMLDANKLTQQLSRLITPSVSEMILVGLGKNRPGSHASRRLNELVSIMQDLPILQSKQVIDAEGWAEAVQKVVQPGDLVVCQADPGAKHLVDELSQITASPVHLLTGLQPPIQSRLARMLNRLLFNLFPFVVVAAFFWLQVQIDAQNTGTLHSLVIIMSVLLELGVIFVWSLFI